jgi:hypothetical protein
MKATAPNAATMAVEGSGTAVAAPSMVQWPIPVKGKPEKSVLQVSPPVVDQDVSRLMENVPALPTRTVARPDVDIGDASTVDMGIGKLPDRAVGAGPISRPGRLNNIWPDVISPAAWDALGTVIEPDTIWVSSSVQL